jgi:hypothetical protein
VFLFPCPPPVSTTDADRFLVLASSFQRTVPNVFHNLAFPSLV